MNPRSTRTVNLERRNAPKGAPEHVKARLLGTSYDREVAPWQSWTKADPMAGISPEMAAEIAEYSKKHWGRTSMKNMEELMRQKEMSNEMVKQYRFYNQDELKDTPARVGHILHCLEWLKMFEKVRPAYLSANIRKGLSGLAVWHPREVKQEDGSIKLVEWQYVCGVQVGFMHEYSSMHFDSHGLPLNEKWRGWRTVNLRLIQMGHMTEEQEREIFGEAIGEASRRHKEQLYFWRNRNRNESDTKDE